MMKKKSVDLRLLYDILRGLKALCDIFQIPKKKNYSLTFTFSSHVHTQYGHSMARANLNKSEKSYFTTLTFIGTFTM